MGVNLYWIVFNGEDVGTHFPVLKLAPKLTLLVPFQQQLNFARR